MSTDQELKQRRQAHAKNLVKIWKERTIWLTHNRELLIFTYGEEWFQEQQFKLNAFPSEEDLKLPDRILSIE